MTALVAEHSSAILTVAWRMLGDRALAEDVAQETFLAAFRALPDFRGDARFSTWLFRIAVNRCRDVLRTHATRREVYAEAGDGDADALLEFAGESADHRSPEQRLLDQYRDRRVSEALHHLPPLYREAFVLRHIEGLSYEEMSEVLGVDGGTLRTRVYKARKELSEQLAELATR
jgi:RNA polymerase sigma-70 factor (ECF subfamily)